MKCIKAFNEDDSYKAERLLHAIHTMHTMHTMDEMHTLHTMHTLHIMHVQCIQPCRYYRVGYYGTAYPVNIRNKVCRACIYLCMYTVCRACIYLCMYTGCRAFYTLFYAMYFMYLKMYVQSAGM
jgi:hypothetical protein